MRRRQQIILEQLELPLLRLRARGETLYQPCRYCGLDTCRIAPTRYGILDPYISFPWTRRDLPEAKCRIELSPCEVAEYIALRFAIGLRGESQIAAVAKEQQLRAKAEEQAMVVPELTAQQIVDRIFPVLEDKPRSLRQICIIAGLELSDKVMAVMRFLEKRGRVEGIMDGHKWRLNV